MTASAPALRSTAGELAERLGAELIGDPSAEISRLDALEDAGPGSLTFIREAKFVTPWASSTATGALAPRSLADDERVRTLGAGRVVLLVDDPDLALISLLSTIAPEPGHASGVHASAVVDPSATVHPGASLGPHVSVGAGAVIADGAVLHAGVAIDRGVRIGEGCVIHANAVVAEGSEIGRGVRIHPGAVVGGDGFGYRPAPDGSGLLKVPHVGNVVIEDGVEIGSNTTIDRAKLGSTRIGAGTKIDNLVMIGHNCIVGRCCLICGCCAMAGSVTIGDGVTLAGGVAIADNIRIGSRVTVGARSGVMNDIPDGETWVGYPARPARETLRIVAATEQLPDTLKRLRSLLKGEKG